MNTTKPTAQHLVAGFDDAILAHVAQTLLDAIRQAQALEPVLVADLPNHEQWQLQRTALLALRRHNPTAVEGSINAAAHALSEVRCSAGWDGLLPREQREVYGSARSAVTAAELHLMGLTDAAATTRAQRIGEDVRQRTAAHRAQVAREREQAATAEAELLGDVIGRITPDAPWGVSR